MPLYFRSRSKVQPLNDDAALGQFSVDMAFLQELWVEKETEQLGHSLGAAALDGVGFLEDRRDFWKKQDPKHYKSTGLKKEMRI